MQKDWKIHLAIAAAIVTGALFFYFDSFTTNHIQRSAEVFARLRKVESMEYRINTDLFENSYLLYTNYDYTEDLLQQLDGELQELLQLQVLQGNAYRKTRESLENYRNAFQDKRRYVESFKTLNSPMKNSLMYISDLVLKFQEDPEIMQNPGFLYTVIQIASSINLSIESMDEDFTRQLLQRVDRLTRYRFRSPSSRELSRLFLAHARFIVKNQKRYMITLENARSSRTSEIMKHTIDHFLQENRSVTRIITLLSIVFTLLFYAAIAIILYFLIRTDREYRVLTSLQKKLEDSIRFDQLTGLYSRRSYEKMVHRYVDPVCVLVNIDSFRQINDFYGIQAGDHILGEYAGLLREIQEQLPFDTELYKPGGDDFAFLFENPGEQNQQRDLLDPVLELILTIIEKSDQFTIYYQGLEISLRVFIGLARGDHPLEKADMILKYLKRETRLRYLEYNPELEIQKEIEENIHLLKYIKDSLDGNRLVPFFQPIFSNRDGSLSHYEALARFQNPDGTWTLPDRLFDIARESRLYNEVTLRILDLVFSTLRRNPEVRISVNVSVEDIHDEQLVEHLLGRMDLLPDMARRLSFEILESENIKDYGRVQTFIKQIRSRGGRIALDDFGAGYSNFNHMLNLQIDCLKIDGSLIRHLDRDVNARHIVRTVVEFCRKAEIQTIAEFVHSEEIHRIVTEMGVDYSQGFYFQEPAREIGLKGD